MSGHVYSNSLPINQTWQNCFASSSNWREVMSDEIFKNAIHEASKNTHDKIKEDERKAQEKFESDRKAETELEESARIEKKINDLKIASKIAIEVFSGSTCRNIQFRFEVFAEACRKRINRRASRTKADTIDLTDDEFQMILDSLVKDGYIIRRKGNRPPLDIHVTYQYNSDQ